MQIGEFSGIQVRSGASCGSGFLLGLRNGRGYVGTNAHVAGTAVGSIHDVISVLESGETVSVKGRLIAAGYRGGSAVDWAILELSEMDYRRLPGSEMPRRLSDFDAARSVVYVGGPRCELPSLRRVRFRSVRGAIAYGTPAAIPGMSGGAWQQGSDSVAITTWTDGTHNMAQTGQALRATMRPDWFVAAEHADPMPDECVPAEVRADLGGFSLADFALPADAVPACENPKKCETGYFCETSALTAEEIVFGPRDDAAELLREVASGFDWLELLEILLPILLEAWRNRRR